LRQPAGDSPPQLYVKPDDRWEANDVASRCPQIVERLSELLSDFEQRCREGRPLPDEPLDSELVAPRR
jgi:hypothetical protein